MSYLPDQKAIEDGTPFTRQLSQRDLSLQIPINYVSAPGVVLKPACFSHDRYEDAAIVKCFSNLLAVNFRRFVVDLYWDVSRDVWSLCPAQLGNVSSDRTSRNRERSGLREDLRARENGPNSDSLTITSTLDRTTATSVSSPSTTVTLTPNGTKQTRSGTTPAQPTASNAAGTAIQVGPYVCTPSANLDLVLDILSSHLDSTQTNVNATIKYLIFNLHEATNATGESHHLSGTDLPHGDHRLGTILEAPATNLSQYLYTPDDLANQRADLNASFSWFAVNPADQPTPAYFDVDRVNGTTFTPNGWPAESFVEMVQAKRLIVGVGDVDPQLSDYVYTDDDAPIFTLSDLDDAVTVGLAANGDVTSGCFFDPGTDTVSAVNNSWASFALGPSSFTNPATGLTSAFNLTRCGISPILNATLGGFTAGENFEPYQDFVQSTVWSWAPGEPVNNTTPDSDDPAISNRCAVLDAADGLWQTENCGAYHHSACRSLGQPYEWNIGDFSITYEKAGLGCYNGTEFDTPRTALENHYLLQAWRDAIASRDVTGDTLLWVNFNDLDATACWVIGQNATCPYLNRTPSDRIVIVPTIAAIIVFVLTALTIFVKCASNRQTSKRRRRRRDDGWDYEGVPS